MLHDALVGDSLNAACSVLSREVDGEIVSNVASNTKLALGIVDLIDSDLENVNSACFNFFIFSNHSFCKHTRR
jgi:hypothetical protein